jgi:hypothetical protein
MGALETVLAIAVGVSLSACAGLRAFLPLFVSGLLQRLGLYHYHSFEWLGTTPALVALGVACIVEVAADKVPALDHVLDVAATPLRTVSGGLVAVAAVAPFPTWAIVLLGIAGGGAALSVHATKATVRGASTVTTAGLGNPILSIAEDLACVAGSILAPLLWVAALIFAFVALVVIFFAVRLVVRKLSPAPAVTSGPSPAA